MQLADPLTYVLVIGGALGAALKCLTDRSLTLLETLKSASAWRDVIFGAAIGVLWQVPIAGVWPIIDFKEQMMSPLAAGTIVGVVSYASVDIIAERVLGAIRGATSKLPGGPPVTPAAKP